MVQNIYFLPQKMKWVTFVQVWFLRYQGLHANNGDRNMTVRSDKNQGVIDEKSENGLHLPVLSKIARPTVSLAIFSISPCQKGSFCCKKKPIHLCEIYRGVGLILLSQLTVIHATWF